MSYGDSSAIIQLTDQVGESGVADVPAPDEGKTILYTTEQGLVFERPASQWFCDAPAFIQNDQPGGLTATPVTVGGWTVPDSIDSGLPTIYKIEVAITGSYAADGTSYGIYVRPYVDGSPAAPAQLIAGNGDIGATCIFWVTADWGVNIEIKAYLENNNDEGQFTSLYGTIRRDFRAFP